ncbi:MAG: hypothetical protein JSW65_07925, partial [Candidatus Bipolaricaulota bacterium]
MIAFARPLVLLGGAAILAALIVYRKQWIALLPAAVAAALLLAALAGPHRIMENAHGRIAFLVDRSPSVRRTTSVEELSERMAAVASGHPERDVSVICFAERAATATAPTAVALVEAASEPLGEATDPSSALSLALALQRPGEPLQLVLLSDGRFTGGADEAVAKAQQAGAAISCIPVGNAVLEDVAVTALDLPSEVAPGQPFAVRFDVRAERPGPATVAVYRGNELLHTSTEPLVRGINRFTIHDELLLEGGYEYRVVVRRASDVWVENDTLAAFTRTSDTPRILLVTKEDDPPVAALLEGSGRSYSTASSVPSVEGLAGVRQILVAGFPLADLSALELATLDAFSGQLGGSLLVVEGEDALRGFGGGDLEDL